MPFPYEWKPGEHIAVVGKTGSGKTVLCSYLLRYMREYVISLKSKSDKTRLPGINIKEAKGIYDPRSAAFILEPEYGPKQIVEFARAMEYVWKQGAWTVNLDELYALEQMKLNFWINRMLTQGRSKDISVMMGMQRPKRVTRFALSQATHYICFNQKGDDRDVMVAETTPELKSVIPTLGRHEFVWYYVPDDTFWRGTLQSLDAERRKSEMPDGILT